MSSSASSPATTVVAPERVPLQQLWADETLTDSVDGSSSRAAAASAAAVVTQTTAFPDAKMAADDRVLARMLEREEKERTAVVSLGGYESQGSDVRVFMRDMVVRWMHEVTEERQCEQEVFPLAVVYLDQVVKVITVRRNQLQLAAAACLLIASKFRDTDRIGSGRLVAYTDHSITADELMTWELLVLNALKWNVHYLTPHDFLEVLLCRMVSLNSTQRSTVLRHAQTFANVCIIDSLFANCPPSLVACSCLNVAVIGLLAKDISLATHLARILRDATAIDEECLGYWSDRIETAWRSMLLSGSSDQITVTNFADKVDNVSSKSYARPTSNTPTDVRNINLIDH